MRNIVFAAAFPPPMHGLAKISDSIASDLANHARVHRYDLSSRSLTRTFAYHIRRLVSVARAAIGVSRNAVREKPCLYIPADGGYGLIYTLLLVMIARMSGQSIIVHHHSFSAIDRRTRVMSMLVAVSGRHAIHVFLCRCMRRKFCECYPRKFLSAISSNAAHLSAPVAAATQAGDHLTLGLLSNLTAEKGLHVFLDLMRSCAIEGLPVQGTLAGPIEAAEDAAAVQAAQHELGERLIYLGPRYGAEKDQFLSSLDVFVFPTSYRNEAQPNVVFEAMAAGSALVSFARGCIAEDVGDDCGLLIDPADDFVAAATARIAQWSKDRASLARAQSAAQGRFLERRATARTDYDELLRMIASEP